MQTHSYTPAAPLSDFIDTIWLLEAGSFTFANLTLPMLHHEMVINFSTRFEVSLPASGAAQQRVILNKRAWISGLQTQPIQTVAEGRQFTAGVLFKPWGLPAIMGTDAFELQNAAVDLETAFGSEALQLIEEIQSQSCPSLILNIIEKFLLKKLAGHSIPGFLVQSLHSMQHSMPEDGIINKLACELGVSPKTLIGSFKKYIGVTPGKYHHLLLLTKVLHYLARHSSQPLTGSSYDLNFFDQAHFIHFFKKYTGFTPSQYLGYYKEGKVPSSNPHSVEIVI